MGRDYKVGLCVMKQVSQLSQMGRSVSNFFSELLVPHNFGGKSDVLLLLQSPENSWSINLTVCKKPSLLPIICSVCYFFGPCVQRVRMNWTVPSISEEELWTRGSEVYAGKGGDVEDPCGVWD